MKLEIRLPNRTETFSSDADFLGCRLIIGRNNYCIIDSLEDVANKIDIPFSAAVREIRLADTIHLTLHEYRCPVFTDLTLYPGLRIAELITEEVSMILTV